MSLDTLQDVFRMVFDDEELRITADTTANDVDGWDSLSHVNLILAVETRFKVRFTQKELLTLKSVGDLHRAILSKSGQ
jgi:acyl carrier protein